MADKKQLHILKIQGVKAWSRWRMENKNTRPDLRRANLSGTNLRGATLGDTDLTGASLRDADFTGATVNKHTSSLSRLSATQRESLEFVGYDGEPEDAPPEEPDTKASRKPLPAPVIGERSREVLIANTEDLSRLFRERSADAGLSNDEIVTVETHLEAVRHLLVAPQPEIGLVLRALRAPAEIIKGMTVVTTLFLGLLLEISLVIDQLEAMGVDGTSLRALVDQIRSLLD